MQRWKQQGQIYEAQGGWCVCTDEDNQEVSGPWSSYEAAAAAKRGDFDEAHKLERSKHARSIL